MVKHGFIAAGNGQLFSDALKRLSEGDYIYVYQVKSGYVGFGIVRGPRIIAKDFCFPDGTCLSDVELENSKIFHDEDNPELSEYVVAVEWKKTVPIAEAKTFPNAFANQHVVCKLRDTATLDFLAREFGVRE